MIKFKTLRTRIFTILASTIIFVAGLISFYLLYDLELRSYRAFDSVTTTINNALVANIKGFVYNNDRKNMQYTIESIQSPYIKNIVILNSKGEIIASQSQPIEYNQDYNCFKKLIKSPTHSIKNDEQHLILSTFLLLDIPLGYLVVEANLQHYNNELNEELRGLLIMIISLFILTLSIAYYLSKSLSQPMYNIIKTLQSTKDDEVLIFEDASEQEFNYLIKNISKKHNALLLLNSKLEEKVTQKTIELQELNKNLKEKIAKAVKDAQAREQLFHQQTRLAQMGEMISLIAHQWKQPLTAMSSTMMLIDRYIETDKYDLSQESEREGFIKFLEQKHDTIQQHIDYLALTTDDFRNLFNPNTEKNQSSINTPVQKALKLMSSPIKSKNIKLIVELNSKKKCNLYKNEIMQVILNILKNSNDTLLESNKKEKYLSVCTFDTQTESVIQISDNGLGIPKEIQEKIFDPYFSTKNQKIGTGLGLYMSKSLVEEHNGGKLEFKTSDQGTCFILSFKFHENQ